VELPPVVHRALAHPGIEDGLDRNLELLERVLRERPAGVPADDLQEAPADLPERRRIERDVDLRADFHLDGLELLVEQRIRHAQRHLAEQLDEAPVGVVAEPLVRGVTDEPGEGRLVQAEIEDGIHHAGHGQGAARAHGHEQRVLGAAEALARGLLEARHVRPYLVHRPGRQAAVTVGEIGQAGLRGNHEPGRHVEADPGHLAEVGALAAEEHLVPAVSFRERVNPLRSRHGTPLPWHGQSSVQVSRPWPGREIRARRETLAPDRNPGGATRTSRAQKS